MKPFAFLTTCFSISLLHSLILAKSEYAFLVFLMHPRYSWLKHPNNVRRRVDIIILLNTQLSPSHSCLLSDRFRCCSQTFSTICSFPKLKNFGKIVVSQVLIFFLCVKFLHRREKDITSWFKGQQKTVSQHTTTCIPTARQRVGKRIPSAQAHAAIGHLLLSIGPVNKHS
jgi:hypothetical protein